LILLVGMNIAFEIIPNYIKARLLRINMKICITKILATVMLTGWMGFAQATLIFDFEFTDGTNTVSGEILGLVDNTANQASSAVVITSNTTNFGIGFEFRESLSGDNVFTVVNGQIFEANLLGQFVLNDLGYLLEFRRVQGKILRLFS